MLAVYDTIIPQFHNFLQSNVVNQVSMLAIKGYFSPEYNFVNLFFKILFFTYIFLSLR